MMRRTPMNVDLANPVLWALVIGWIMTVVLHEFAHGVVALWGGDYTIRERGGLTLNPLQYVEPFTSIVLPVIFLLIGGIALPGGATYIRRDLLRGRAWASAVSAAGPAMNLLIFALLGALVQPWAGWVDPSIRVDEWSTFQIFVASLAFLQLFAAILNLLPLPPLDGFGIISPWLSPGLQARLVGPPMGNVLLLVFFLLLITGVLMRPVLLLMSFVCEAVGYDLRDMMLAFRTVMYGPGT